MVATLVSMAAHAGAASAASVGASHAPPSAGGARATTPMPTAPPMPSAVTGGGPAPRVSSGVQAALAKIRLGG